jgi:hypothetical protein
VESWDSLGLVLLAVGIHLTFGYWRQPFEVVEIA